MDSTWSTAGCGVEEVDASSHPPRSGSARRLSDASTEVRARPRARRVLVGMRARALVRGPLPRRCETGATCGSHAPRLRPQILHGWLRRHADHPYPDEGDKAALSAASGLTLVQLRNWCGSAIHPCIISTRV